MVPHTHGCFQSSHVSVKNKCKVGSWAVPSGVLIQGGRVGCVLSGQVMLSEFPDLHRVRKIGVPAVLHCTDMHFCACCLQELCHMEMECSELRVTRSYSQLQLCFCEATGQVCHSLDSSKVCVCSYIENRCIAQAEGCSFFFPFFLFFFSAFSEQRYNLQRGTVFVQYHQLTHSANIGHVLGFSISESRERVGRT